MTRDMDLVRDLLLKIEGGQRVFKTISAETAAILAVDADDALSEAESEKLIYHLDLLKEAGFIDIGMRSGGGMYVVGGITWNGHEFLDAVRNDTVWRKVKEKAAATGIFAAGALKELGIAYAKKELGLP